MILYSKKINKIKKKISNKIYNKTKLKKKDYLKRLTK